MADSQTETFTRNLARLAATGYSIDDLVRGHRVLAERQRKIDEFLREFERSTRAARRHEGRAWLRFARRLRRIAPS